MRRLKNHTEFVGVLHRHHHVSGPDIVIHYTLTPVRGGGEGYSRFQKGVEHERKMGLAVSTRVGHAVVRNKIKRRFRVLGHKYENLLPPGCEIILRARKGAARAKFSSLDTQVEKLFLKIRYRAHHPQPSHRVHQTLRTQR